MVCIPQCLEYCESVLANSNCPSEFTEHQRNVFCVFSGQGVSSLRRHLNTDAAFAHLRDSTPTGHPRHPQNPVEFGYNPAPAVDHGDGPADNGFDEPERDAIEDDDGLDDSEMALDPVPPAQNNNVANNLGGASLDASMIPPPPPPPPIGQHLPQWNSNSIWQSFHQQLPIRSSPPPPSNAGHYTAQAGFGSSTGGPSSAQLPDGMDVTTPRPSASSASTSSGPDAGPSTASLHATSGDNANASAAEGSSRSLNPSAA